jgi:3-hydroxyanthranilate 3,4-dioxygenase
MLQAFDAAAGVGNYADLAVLPEDVDPQITVSRNWVDQPFHLAFEEDTVLAQLSGRCTVHLRGSNVLNYPMSQGDHVYMPAGTPHRITPENEGVLIRYITNGPAIRAAIFFCDGCEEEIYRLEWTQQPVDDATAIYAEICRRFNEQPTQRTCSQCGAVAPQVSLDSLGWDMSGEPV